MDIKIYIHSVLDHVSERDDTTTQRFSPNGFNASFITSPIRTGGTGDEDHTAVVIRLHTSCSGNLRTKYECISCIFAAHATVTIRGKSFKASYAEFLPT